MSDRWKSYMLLNSPANQVGTNGRLLLDTHQNSLQSGLWKETKACHWKRKHYHLVKCERILAPEVPPQLDLTKLHVLLLSAVVNCFLLSFCVINKGKTSTAGCWDHLSQCTRMISRPQQEHKPVALTRSALLHHVWPSALAPSRSPPSTGTQK